MRRSGSGVGRSGSTMLIGCGAAGAAWATLGIWTSCSSRSRAATVSVASRRRRRRHDRHSRAVAPQSAGRPPLLPEVVERTGLCPSTADHRQTAQLPRGLPHHDAVGGALHGPVRQQSGGSLASADATTRATDAPVQIRRAGATISRGPRRRVESIPSQPPPAASRSLSPATCTCVRGLAGGDVCLLRFGRGRPARPGLALRPLT